MKTVTFRPVVYAQYKRRDGLYPVRIRVTFDRKSKYLTTNITATASQLTRGLAIKDATLAALLEDLCRDFRRRAARLNAFALERMSIDDVVAYISAPDEGEAFRLDFPTFARGVIARQGAGAKNYASALNALSAFVGRDRYDISLLSSSFFVRWQAALEDEHGVGARAVSLYIQAVAYIYRRAREEYNDEENGTIRVRNPFARYRCPVQPAGRHRNAPPALLVLMLWQRHRLTGRERLGVDVFLLSFALMGMNAPDLYECPRAVGGVLEYGRRKTRDRRADGALMRVRVEGCVRALFEEYAGSGTRAFCFADRYGRHEDFGRAVNIGLHQFAARNGLTAPLTLYVARHTWATVARSAVCGVDKSVVNDCICHVDTGLRVTDIYAQKDWRVLWEANAKVLINFPWQLLQR